MQLLGLIFEPIFFKKTVIIALNTIRCSDRFLWLSIASSFTAYLITRPFLAIKYPKKRRSQNRPE